jgi:hypothetical protein
LAIVAIWIVRCLKPHTTNQNFDILDTADYQENFHIAEAAAAKRLASQ